MGSSQKKEFDDGEQLSLFSIYPKILNPIENVSRIVGEF